MWTWISIQRGATLEQLLSVVNQRMKALEGFLKHPRPSAIELQDGITEPAEISGVAQIYVDAADGDLKVIFGDGTVKTIVVDT